MRYKITLQEHGPLWVYVIAFGTDTPTALAQAAEYSDHSASAEDLHGIRHCVLYRRGKIVQIQLHNALRILPDLDPSRPASLRMPVMQAITFGEPPTPTLLIQFTEAPLNTKAAYALSPNVFLVFDGDDLAQLYVTDVHATIQDAETTPAGPPGRDGSQTAARSGWWRRLFGIRLGS